MSASLQPTSSGGTGSLAAYLREIATYPILSRERESELAERAKRGDAGARERLICSNLRFVVAIAKKYRHRGVGFEDLINVGNLGLMRAVQRFDAARGCRLITYAVWWIRQSMGELIAEHGNAVRVPLGLGANPIPAPLSLDSPHRDSDTAMLETLPDEHATAPDESLVAESEYQLLKAALAQLNPKDHAVITRYFGLDGAEAETLEEIGGRLSISRERIRQIKDRALKRLRGTRQLRDLAAALQ